MEKKTVILEIPSNKLETYQDEEKKIEKSWKIELPSSFFLSNQSNEIFQKNEYTPQDDAEPKKEEVYDKEYDLKGIEDLPKAVIDFDD